MNGPTDTAQLGGGWPNFGAGKEYSNGVCNFANSETRFTGHVQNGGLYCKRSSTALDDNPHLAIYSGNVGVVLDASGGT